MKKPKLRELKEAVTALFTGPYTDKFPFGPAKIHEEFRGKPIYHPDDCIGCGACSEVCPPGAIEVSTIYKNGKPFRKLTIDLGVCVYCGTCVEKCTTKKGISQTREFDLSSFNPADMMESVEKEMVVCEICGNAFTTRDQLIWIYKKIGSQGAANWTVMLVGQEELGVVGHAADRDKPKIALYDHMRILCPECRCETILADEWGAFE